MNASPIEDLRHCLSAGQPMVQVETQEDDRLEEYLKKMALEMSCELWIWKASTGLVGPSGVQNSTQEMHQALAFCLQSGQVKLVWFVDFELFVDPLVVRMMRDLYQAWRFQNRLAIFSTTSMWHHKDIQREMAQIRMGRMADSELKNFVDSWLSEHEDLNLNLEPDVLAGTLKGLTRAEMKHALKRIEAEKVNGDDALALLQEEKVKLIESLGTLQFIPEVPKLNNLGGLEHLKSWLIQREALLLSTDPQLRAISPKGILLMGISGCGKSLCIKAISSAWKLPLYRLEMSSIFAGGQPELAFVRACKAMEDLSPAVLWIDEIEMGLAAEGSTASDPVLSRIFAFFLTWMQEKPHGLFVAATANRIDLLPAEMIRKGRFDQVFFVDLPTLVEREDIFRIHLSMRGYDPDLFEVPVFADSAKGWTGAEIEQCVVAAVTQARMENRELELKDLYLARKQIVPLSQTMEEQVRHIRNWAYERAVRASAAEES